MEPKAIRFVSEQINVSFGARKGLQKRPVCPESFLWRGASHVIVELMAEWHDYSRKGKMAHNMRPSHLASAEQRGSWGVGRHYFRVRTADRRIFDIYYDRAPKDAVDRKGGWWVLRELAEEP